MIITSEDHILHPANADYLNMTNEEIKVLVTDNGFDLSSLDEQGLEYFCSKLRSMKIRWEGWD